MSVCMSVTSYSVKKTETISHRTGFALKMYCIFGSIICRKNGYIKKKTKPYFGKN